MAYQSKIVDYNYKKKVVSYALPIRTGGCNRAERKNYREMSMEEREKSDGRRIRYYKKVSSELVELALMNSSFKVMITLTFSEHITDYHTAIRCWKNFVRRLKYSFGEFCYICVWERMKNGRIHFHVLLDLNLTHGEVKRFWKYGKIVWVSRIKDGYNGRKQAILYMTKYMCKSIQERIQSGESIRGERFFFCSKNLEKPKIEKIEERLDIQEQIFENMEDIIKDGTYEIKDCNGKTINRSEFVEYKNERRRDVD